MTIVCYPIEYLQTDIEINITTKKVIVTLIQYVHFWMQKTELYVM